MKRLLSIGLLCSMVIYACTNTEAPEPAKPLTACDSADIRAARIYEIISTSCVNRSCHPGGGTPARADFSSLQKLENYITANPSFFATRVTSATADMPQIMGYQPLSAAVKDSIACWISKGMPH
ncbi:hypothetical protein LX64_02984 [Chitinophaga skermanii]|uniref:Cytochrome c domain-containing protein n=1 Tax=Chitinophaga skermanii TaxID=331697 RepID=A0A327QHL4_9BACT|nr:hypothetical protein [Chitinophaga skermanii]RAJ04106.1 hypothetical protein LX64_02984 [Chitinophaga skermanii]